LDGGGGNTAQQGGSTKTKTKKQCSSVYRGVRQRPWGRYEKRLLFPPFSLFFGDIFLFFEGKISGANIVVPNSPQKYSY